MYKISNEKVLNYISLEIVSFKDISIILKQYLNSRVYTCTAFFFFESSINVSIMSIENGIDVV